nr:MAG TPA: hypothetical protein [Caudoviricetes sp.]DAR03410.1 MAG TPA: hypothetical protein [Caudoviricetes sp.]
MAEHIKIKLCSYIRLITFYAPLKPFKEICG